jgi:hypothetical protein
MMLFRKEGIFMRKELKKCCLFLILLLCSLMPAVVLAQQDSEIEAEFIIPDSSVVETETSDSVSPSTAALLPQLDNDSIVNTSVAEDQIETQVASDDFQYSEISGGVAITRYIGNDSQITIPDTLNGQPVVEIASNALKSNGIYTSIIVGNNVKTIRTNAIGNYSLQTVTIPSTTTVIEANAISVNSTPVLGLKVIGIAGSEAQTYVENSGLENLVFVDQNMQENGFYYTIEGDKAELVHYVGSEDTLILPATLGGKLLASVASYAIVDPALSRFECNSELENIEEFAFSGCCPYGVGYNKLNTIFVPSSSTTIIKSNYAEDFSLSALKKIIGISGSQVESFAAENNIIFLVMGNLMDNYWYEAVSGGVKISYYEGADSIITIPESLAGSAVVAIGDKAFADNDSLIEVTIPDSVTSLEDGNSYYDGIFYDCNALTKLTLGTGITHISDRMATNCYKLQEVILNGAVKSIGNSSFMLCGSLQGINLPDSLESIESYGLAMCDSLQSINFPDSLKSIGQGAFYGCNSLEGIILPDSLENIGDVAFAQCNGITSIDIPDKTATIGSGAFAYCEKLTDLTFGSGLTSLGERAAAECDSLETVIIPNGLSTIEAKDIFTECAALSKVQMPESISSITTNIFEESPNTTIYGLTGSYIESYADMYNIPFIANGETQKGELSAFIGQDLNGNYFLYNKVDFNNAYLAYQINPDLAAAKMYKHFFIQKCQIVALKDLNKGYMDYQAAAIACLMAQMQGETFDIDEYLSNSSATYAISGSLIKVVDENGNVSN